MRCQIIQLNSVGHKGQNRQERAESVTSSELLVASTVGWVRLLHLRHVGVADDIAEAGSDLHAEGRDHVAHDERSDDEGVDCCAQEAHQHAYTLQHVKGLVNTCTA